MGPLSLKLMTSFEHKKNGDWQRKFLLQGNMLFDINVSNAYSKNLVVASPFNQNLYKMKNW